MRRAALALLAVALAASQAYGQEAPAAPANPAQPRSAPEEPDPPLELIRLPLRSAVIERGCGFGFLSFFTRAELVTRNRWVGQVGVFGRCRFFGRLQLRFIAPVVLGGFYSGFEGVKETGPGNPSFELKWQAWGWRRFYITPYLGASFNLALERAGFLEPGLAVSAVVRGVSLHANSESQIPFGVGNGRRTYGVGLSASYPIRPELTAHLGAQNAIDVLSDSFWSDARALTVGARYGLSPHWVVEAGLRIAPLPEAELIFNSLGNVAGFVNVVNRPAMN